MSNELNADGLAVQYGNQIGSVVGTDLATKHRMAIDFKYDNLPTFTTDANGDGTNTVFSGSDAVIPAGCFITNAYIVVTTAFAGGTSYNIGTYEADGTVIDADGIDAAVATAALAANKGVVCDGAQVGGTVLLTADAYPVIAATGTFTAGEAKLYIEYIEVLA